MMKTVQLLHSVRDKRSRPPLEDTHLLAISLSHKPRTRRSASRYLLEACLKETSKRYPFLTYLDLARFHLPWFTGADPLDMNSKVQFAHRAVNQCGCVFFAIPAYWGSISGTAKNFVELMAGPNYQSNARQGNVFFGKPVSFLLVGADSETAGLAAEQFRAAMGRVGATLGSDPAVFGNPEHETESANLWFRQGVACMGGLLRHMILQRRQGDDSGPPEHASSTKP